MTENKNIETIMNELAEYNALMDELKATVSGLQDEVKAYMTENGVDEVITANGHKATFRAVTSNRFCTSSFRKVHGDLYKAFTKPTTAKRFTFNA